MTPLLGRDGLCQALLYKRKQKVKSCGYFIHEYKLEYCDIVQNILCGIHYLLKNHKLIVRKFLKTILLVIKGWEKEREVAGEELTLCRFVVGICISCSKLIIFIIGVIISIFYLCKDMRGGGEKEGENDNVLTHSSTTDIDSNPNTHENQQLLP